MPEMLSESLSCFIPGSKSMLIVSRSRLRDLRSPFTISTPGIKVSLSVAQLNGGSMRRVTVVGSGPAFPKLKVLLIGIDATPFSQRYLNASFVSLKSRLGVMKSPVTLVLKASFGFLSPPMVAWHYQFSRTLPTLNEFARN